MDNAGSELSEILDRMALSKQHQKESMNELERFIQSNLITALWRHQPSHDQKFLQKHYGVEAFIRALEEWGAKQPKQE